MAVSIYVRVSTEEQRERQCILTQREFADRFCALLSLAVSRVYGDDGVSGTVPLERRPEGGQILSDARQGKFNQLLVYRLDRLGRDTRLILNAVDELEKLHVRVRSMTEAFDTGSATGRLMSSLRSLFRVSGELCLLPGVRRQDSFGNSSERAFDPFETFRVPSRQRLQPRATLSLTG